MIGSLGDELAFFFMLLLGVAALGVGLALGAVVAIIHAAIVRTWPAAVRSFVSGIGLLPVAGVLFGACLDVGPSSDDMPLLAFLAVCAIALASWGIVLGQRLAAELERPLFLAETPGRIALALAAVAAIAAVIFLGR